MKAFDITFIGAVIALIACFIPLWLGPTRSTFSNLLKAIATIIAILIVLIIMKFYYGFESDIFTFGPPKVKKDATCNHIINNGDVEDYSNNLNPEEYLRYSSNYQDFYFFYPPHLFNKVECNFDDYKTILGKNIESHTFFGSNGAEVSFELSSRTDTSSNEKAFSDLYQQASSEIQSSKKDFWKGNTNISGFAVSGFDNQNRIIYRLIRIYGEYVMDLRIVCPPYVNNDNEDRRQKRYVQECIIKKCGFTNPEWKENIKTYSDFENN